MRNIYKKKYLLVLCLIVFFTGCRNKADQDALHSEPVELVVESRLFGPMEERRYLMEEIFPEFERENNCIVRFSILDDDSLLKKAQFQRESGKVKTDVIIAHCGIMSEWIHNDYVIPLPVEEWTDRNFFKAFYYDITSRGKTYFAPVGGDVYLMLINKKALPYKPEGADPQDLSWEEYVQWALNIAEGEGEGKVGVTGVPRKSLIYMYGCVFLSYGGKFPIINSPGAVKGWTLMANMKYAYSPHIDEYDNMTAPMESGEVWMTVAHMVRMGEVYKENPDDFILAPAPRGPAGIGSIIGTSGFAVMHGAPHKELAVKFIKFMTEPERAVAISRGTGGFIPPVYESLEKLGKSIEDEIIRKGMNILKNGIVSGVPGADYASWEDVKQVYDDAFRELVLTRGQADISYLNDAQIRLDQLRN